MNETPRWTDDGKPIPYPEGQAPTPCRIWRVRVFVEVRAETDEFALQIVGNALENVTEDEDVLATEIGSLDETRDITSWYPADALS